MKKIEELFLGRLGRKPDLRYTLKSEPICYLAVAVNNKENDTAIWKRVVVWGKQAELCSVFLKKGHEVFVQGHKQQRSYEDKEGVKQTIEEVTARLVGFSNI